VSHSSERVESSSIATWMLLASHEAISTSRTPYSVVHRVNSRLENGGRQLLAVVHDSLKSCALCELAQSSAADFERSRQSPENGSWYHGSEGYIRPLRRSKGGSF
jgi:hypothetical protein